MTGTLSEMPNLGVGRYALYFAPEPGNPWWEAGLSWLGSDPVTGAAYPRLQVPELHDEEWQRITDAPRFYGWHATIKAPFALAEGVSEDDLLRRVGEFCAERRGFDLPGLSVEPLHGFLALRLVAPSPELEALAADCVQGLDDLRRPLSPADLLRREEAGLTPRQRDLLHTWGYPYVLEQFRFHLSLTGRLPVEQRTRLAATLSEMWASLTRRRVPVTGLCVFHQSERTAPFRLRWRVRWDGRIEALRGGESALLA